MDSVFRLYKDSQVTIDRIRAEAAAIAAQTVVPSEFVFVSTKSDLPTAVSGVITLEDEYTYFFVAVVDLTGDRIVCGQNTTILGGSSENCRIKSTGLTDALITSEYSLPMRGITIEASLALDLEGDGVNTAIDWFGVNFTDCAVIGTIKDYSNVILTDCAFLNSSGLTFSGTIGTVGFGTCLFDGRTASTTIIIPATATITRRFRVIYSSFIVLSGETGINVSTSATVPIEGYILDTVNFSGGGTYIAGVTFDSDQALFTACIGITNTTAIANVYINDNSTETVVSETGVRYAVSGTSAVSTINQKFTHMQGNNSVRYDSSVPRIMRILCTFSLISGNNNIIGVYIGVKRGESIDPDADRISGSEVYVTTSGTGGEGRPDPGSVQALVSLNRHDEVYMIVQNTTNTNNITVEFMNIIVERSN
jgi:hypothetical protein